MNTVLLRAVLCCTFVVAGTSALALGAGMAVTVDSDAFPLGTDISNAFSGVGITLSSVGAGFDGDNDPRIFAVNPLAYGEPFTPSTGASVFGTNDATWPHNFGGWGGAKLRIDFAQRAQQVMLDAIGNDSSDFAQLEAYNAAGGLLGTYYTGQMTANSFETMVFSTAGFDIAYVLGAGTSGDSVGFDSLHATVTPEPMTLALLALGGLMVARRRQA